MKNLGAIMKQAQEMQEKVKGMQERMAQIEVNGVSGGGLVAVVLNGKQEMVSIKIDSSLLISDDKEVLEDLVLLATNNARANLQKKLKSEMSEISGGLALPFGLDSLF
ncbi:MAG: YbaB/EbfC family nucleoid-associated protein [Rhodospirillaceae bacterium]|nr:YbaB/EbfC family nucleoid-associated protein [Rhodospirillaceae bacterium]|tara:strand:+ start:400 stop:723 length:324 start_codon:yes stop_codon:yes gene_type:complete